ncbi:AAA family ATPase [Vagococcus humatus]|uniref:LuxR family transcriptional regulator n=1 Tax=Vagococcus humatus TaxID=1889241 RepID=A0A3S0GDM3_9ENTE|nr:AAA family ATPase [Vagococcus humatus]RST89420.1 LuxR family transcriptional regulator [Vagococcus humatus]
MKNQVFCQLFGNPQVSLNGEPLIFSFSKINALIYYLVVNKTVSRDEAAGLLWPDKTEKNAKKNLRNTIYQANKMLGDDFISSPNKVLLVLNEELDITSDIDCFLKNPRENLDYYQGEFLKGFFVKESEDYELWTVKMRNFYEKKFVRECFRKVEEDIEMNQVSDVEKNIQKLITIDEFDERNYQLLMQFYQDQDRNGKVIETYYSLANLLKVELGINPGVQTREIYEHSLEIINQHTYMEINRFTSLFYGRAKEINFLERNFARFFKNQPYQSVVITGDAGVGKSSLSNRVLDNVQSDFFILETQCYQAEQRHALRPWKQIIEKLSQIIKNEEMIQPKLWQEVISKVFPDFDDHLPDITFLENQELVKLSLLEQVIIEAIKKVSEVKKLVIMFDDIQWLDSTSYSLLTSVMLHLNSNEALFMFTARNESNESMDSFCASMSSYDKLTTLKLMPFTMEETKEFIQKKLPKLELTDTLIQNIFAHTEGNLFFLIEYISLLETNAKFDVMTVKMQDALRKRFMYLTPDEREVVSVASYFYDQAPLKVLSDILGKEQIDIVNIVEDLVNKNILKEYMENDQIFVKFTHAKLREYIYLNQSLAKKRIFHGKVAEVLENNLQTNGSNQDILMYAKIAHHYEQAKNDLRALDFQLRYLHNYLGFQHELFPVYNKCYLPVENSTGIDQVTIFDQFDSLKQKLTSLEEEYQSSEDFQLLIIKFLYLEGRYFIRYGEYEQGIKDIERVIDKAKEFNNEEYLLSGYKQLVYYCIQVDDAKEMSKYIELALDAAIMANNHESIGILLRLKGLYYMMIGNFTLADKLLKESINTFTLTEEIMKKYSINIAASYNYLGEIEHIQGNYLAALKMYQKAIDLCEDKGSYSSLSVFYINTGASYYALANYEQAKKYLKKAYALYENFSSLWKRPQLDAYMSLVYLEEQRYDKAFDCIVSSKKYSDSLSNPRDLGTVYYAEAIISNELSQKDSLQELLHTVMDQEPIEYYKQAISHLNPYCDVFEINKLQHIFGVVN